MVRYTHIPFMVFIRLEEVFGGSKIHSPSFEGSMAPKSHGFADALGSQPRRQTGTLEAFVSLRLVMGHSRADRLGELCFAT